MPNGHDVVSSSNLATPKNAMDAGAAEHKDANWQGFGCVSINDDILSRSRTWGEQSGLLAQGSPDADQWGCSNRVCRVSRSFGLPSTQDGMGAACSGRSVVQTACHLLLPVVARADAEQPVPRQILEEAKWQAVLNKGSKRKRPLEDHMDLFGIQIVEQLLAKPKHPKNSAKFECALDRFLQSKATIAWTFF